MNKEEDRHLTIEQLMVKYPPPPEGTIFHTYNPMSRKPKKVDESNKMDKFNNIEKLN